MAGVSPEKRLEELGLDLPMPAAPVATYVGVARSGSLLFISGHGSDIPNRRQYRGRLGSELTIEEGCEAARACAINLLATLRAELGSLDRVVRVVKVLGFVSSSPDFFSQPQVINGCSDLLVDVFGEAGRHARSAIGTSCLPLNLPVEVEMVVEVLS
jgi:enamine deaminase RidA (YjgF/YER057c/UK114 family)